MANDVKIFLRKSALFALPFLVYGCVILAIDPYQRFSTGGPVPESRKRDTAFRLNYAMWKLIEYQRHPTADILLGDSRMMNLSAARIDSTSGRRWANLAYGGGTLREAIDTFDFAHSRVELERVYIGLDLSTWNGSDLRDRVSEARGAIRNPLIYVLNGNVVRATAAILQAQITGRNPQIGTPPGDRSEFWRRQLDVTARVYFEGWTEPIAYTRDLKRIAEICRKENIELAFVIFPTHTDLQDLIGRYGLEEQNSRMRGELATLGTVYDFAWPNEMTSDRNMFVDPYHLTESASESVIHSVWGSERKYVRVWGGHDSPGRS